MYNIGIDGPGCSCDGEGCSLCTAPDEHCEVCDATLTDANRGDGIGDLCATCLAKPAPCWFCDTPSVRPAFDEDNRERPMCERCADECDAARKREDNEAMSQCVEEA